VGNPTEHYTAETGCRNNLCDLQIEGTGASPLDVVISVLRCLSLMDNPGVIVEDESA
jgi:hypothetical protein